MGVLALPQGVAEIPVEARDGLERNRLGAHGRALADVRAAAEASASCWLSMLTTRARRSGWPCGSRPRCEIFAPVNSMAEALGHAATHAPQPMQAAASKAASAFSFCTGTEWPPGPTGVDRDVATGLDDAVQGGAVHDEIAQHRETGGAPRFDRDGGAVLEGRVLRQVAHVQLAGGGADGPWACPLMTTPH